MPQPDLQNFNLIQKHIIQTSQTNNLNTHIQLITEIVELPFNRSDAITLLLQSFNNLAIQYYKNDLFCNLILKFASSHLLKNAHSHCNLFRTKLIHFIVQLNMSKLKFQYGQYGKAFLLAERAMRSLEQELIERLKHRDSKIGDATLLVNGYLLLAKCYQYSNEQDLQIIKSKSQWAQKSDDFGKFYFNAKQLALKYLGSNYLYSHRLKKVKECSTQLITRQQYTQIQKIFKIVKCRVMTLAIERPRRCIKGSIIDNKSSITKFRIKRSDDRNSSNETTLENTEKPIFQQLESIIHKKVEEQLKLQESKLEIDTKKKIQNLENSIQNLTQQIKEKEIIQEQQNTQIEMLKRQQTKKQLQQSSIKKPIFINEFQISSEQKKQIFVQSAIKRTEIDDFMAEQTPIKFVKEFQTPKKQNSIKEFQTNYKSTPPLSFSFHKQQEQPKIPSQNITENTIEQHQPTQKLSHISLLELDDLNFSYTYQFNKEEYSVQMMPNEIYSIQINREQNYQIEISLVTNKTLAHLDDYSLLIQININQQRISEMIDLLSLQEILAHTQNVCIPYPIKYLTSYKLFIQYLVIPFITLQEEDETYKIALYHLPQSLLDNYIQYQNFEWSLHYIENCKLKLALFNDKLFTNKIEIQFDQISFDSYFETLNEDEYIEQEMNNMIQKKQSKTRNCYRLPSIKIKNNQKLIDFIQNLLSKLEQELNNKDIIICIKVDENTKIRCFIIEQDNTIRIINLYQSYLNNKLQYVQGSIKITNQIIEDKFHINFSLLQEDERQFLLLKLTNHLKLFSYQTIEEGKDMDWKNELPISFYEQDFGGTDKIMSGENYKYPMNFTIIGVHNKPEFIRIDTFNVEQLKQDGILLFLNEQQWKIITIQKKGKQTKYNKGMQNDYHLNLIMENWKILEKLLQNEKKIFRLEQFMNSKILQEN